MNHSKDTEETIIGMLRGQFGKVGDLTCKYGVSDQSICCWLVQYGGRTFFVAKYSKQVEEKNARLKRIVGELSMDKQMLEDVLSKKR